MRRWPHQAGIGSSVGALGGTLAMSLGTWKSDPSECMALFVGYMIWLPN